MCGSSASYGYGSQLIARGLRDFVRDRLERVRAGFSHLRADVLQLGDVEIVRRLRVAHRELVEGAHAMTEPLAGDEERRADVEAERVVLEGRTVTLAHEKADQAGVGFVHLLLAAGGGHPRGAGERGGARHRVVEPNEAVIEDLDRPFANRPLDRAHADESTGRPGGDPPPGGILCKATG